jgi:hypothetical protein
MTALDQLSQMIPADIALANKALAASMSGITGIKTIMLPNLAQATANIQTNYGLPLVNAQTSAVSTAAVASIISTVGTGTGPHGTVTMMDGLGTAAGWIHTEALANTIAILSTMNTSYLQLGYENMLNTVNGTYVIHVPNPAYDPELPPGPDNQQYLGWEVVVPSGPGAGTYALYTTPALAINAAFTDGLIPAVQSVIAGFSGSYPTQYAALNYNWNNMLLQLAREGYIQYKANLTFPNLVPNSTESIYGFVFALPGYGQDTSVAGTNQYIQAVADKTTLGGQAIIATLRQGQSNVSGTGIGTNSSVPVEPNPPLPQATLTPAQYPYPS